MPPPSKTTFCAMGTNSMQMKASVVFLHYSNINILPVTNHPTNHLFPNNKTMFFMSKQVTEIYLLNHADLKKNK